MPAGFVLNVEKSAPREPKAPPMAIKRADPPKAVREYRRASTSFCDLKLRDKSINMERAGIIRFIALIFINDRNVFLFNPYLRPLEEPPLEDREEDELDRLLLLLDLEGEE